MAKSKDELEKTVKLLSEKVDELIRILNKKESENYMVSEPLSMWPQDNIPPEVKKVKRVYETKLDSKKRITIRGGSKKFYQVREFEDDTIQLQPMLVIPEDEISRNTLKMISSSIKNYKSGKVSEPINLDEISFDDED